MGDLLPTGRIGKGQGNRLSFDCAPDARSAFADRAKLRQCILNLVNNACKIHQARRDRGGGAAPEQCHGGLGGMRVTDTAIGIPSQHLDKLFDPFYQVDGPAANHHNGTGLGLAITKRFCELMNCEIAVESITGPGSCFTLRLPACGGQHPSSLSPQPEG